MRSLLLLIAFLAVLMGSYVAVVQREARRQRYLAAEKRVDRQIRVLRRAFEEAMHSNRETEDLVVKDMASVEKEEQEAKKWPESSDKRELHLLLASQWRAELANVAKRLGREAEIAGAFRARELEILERRKFIPDDLDAIERLAIDAENSPETPVWKRNALANRLASLKAGPDLEPIDPGLVRATAIDQAKGMLKASHPNVDPDRLTIEARGRLYTWTVAFKDPKTKQSYEINCHFSRSSVDEYEARRAALTKRNVLGFRWP